MQITAQDTEQITIQGTANHSASHFQDGIHLASYASLIGEHRMNDHISHSRRQRH